MSPTVLVEDKFGAQTPLEGCSLFLPPRRTLTVLPHGVQNNSQVFTFTILADDTDDEDVKIHLYIPGGDKGVAELVLGSEKTSKAGALTIDLVGPEPGR